MKERLFTLKSYQKGLALQMKPNADMSEMLEQLREKFQNSRQFFGDMQVALAISGRELTVEEEDAILDVIEENSDLQIVCLIGEDEKIQYLFEEALEKNEPKESEPQTDGQFYRGTLKRDQKLKTEHSVIVLGDVNPGAEISSKRDVIVLGALLGTVHAGAESEDGRHFVCALEFSPEKLIIGAHKYKKKPERHLWPDSYKKSPKIAALKGDEIVVKPITKELLNQITLREN